MIKSYCIIHYIGILVYNCIIHCIGILVHQHVTNTNLRTWNGGTVRDLTRLLWLSLPPTLKQNSWKTRKTKRGRVLTLAVSEDTRVYGRKETMRLVTMTQRITSTRCVPQCYITPPLALPRCSTCCSLNHPGPFRYC